MAETTSLNADADGVLIAMQCLQMTKPRNGRGTVVLEYLMHYRSFGRNA